MKSEIRRESVPFYLKTGREEFYSVYLMFFVNGIRFGETTKALVQITRKASRKLDIDEIVF